MDSTALVARQEVIAEVTRLLIEFYRPVRIYLFGSAARGESGPDSDLDFCVVLPDDAPRDLYRDRSIRQCFWNLQFPIDIVRLPHRDFDARAAHVAASLPATIVREGTVLYDSSARCGVKSRNNCFRVPDASDDHDGRKA